MYLFKTSGSIKESCIFRHKV